jgi:trans-AT polyketide synthase/acyltransferase/oxidoreductase domain-containing protein
MQHAPLPTAEPPPQPSQALQVPTDLVHLLRQVGLPIDLDTGIFVPACPPERLGDPAFCAAHGVGFAYYAGAMANGIASVELVETLAKAGFLAFFGAAGLPVPAVEEALARLERSVGGKPFGVNLIHSPNEPAVEGGAVELFLRRGMHLVEASAFLDLTLPLVRYRTAGIRRAADGSIFTPNRVVAKVSRVEVATKFLSPPPAAMLETLVAQGHLTAEQARLAAQVPMAEDLTAEADSGGHTDNRPAIAMLPSMIALRDRLQAQHRFAQVPRVGLAGGISTPAAAAAAFAMGAAYIVTGSVNQACVESGSSDVVRQMLAEAEQADVTMAPAADMFEMGVNLQVLKRGTMFSMRARQLYQLYRAHAGIEHLPAEERTRLEKTIFRESLDTIWTQTRSFFLQRDPEQVARAEQDPKHKMALVFRWYLGMASRWANQGVPDRKIDYQVWCGPAMGAFNEWVRGSFLEQAGERRAAVVAHNILYGAALLTRCHFLRCQGVTPPAEALHVTPMREHELKEYLQ